MAEIIDAHVHVGAWDHADFLGRECHVADVLDVFAESGIAGGAMCPTDRCDNPGLLADMRAALAGDYDGSLWFFPWMRAQGAGGEGDLAFLQEQQNAASGIKVHPSLSRKRITDEAFAPALEFADRKSLVVLVHCGRWQEIASYRFAIEAAQRYPGARFLLAHAGGDTPPNATAAAELVLSTGVENVWFEFSGLREYWVIERNVARIGAERYLMGSDYSLAHPLMYIGAIRGMSLTEAEKDRILGGNARALFGPPLAAER